jgi:hypothetical protein
VGKFVTEFLRWLSSEHLEYSKEITSTGKFSDELVGKVTDAMKNFKSLGKK